MQPSRQLTARLPGYAALLRHVQVAPAPSFGHQTASALGGDSRLRLFEPATPRCPLPGGVGPAASAVTSAVAAAAPMAPVVSATGDPMLELTARPCPASLRRDLAALLGPDSPHGSPDLSVVTLAHRTRQDMSAWSPRVQAEREALTEQFVSAAGQLCRALRSAGYWCDFIDPTSGRPFEAVGGSDALFETDERYRSLGFDIEDLGCCKVITHPVWGARVFVGSLFTNAPIDHPLIAGLA